MKSTSISRLKNFKHCPLSYLYTYVEKFRPEEVQPIWVQTKGLVLHQTFEELLKYENYTGDAPGMPYQKADTVKALEIFKHAMDENNFPIDKAIEFNLKLGLKRWLSFKHDYLDKRSLELGHLFYAEKQYNEKLFGETTTITILDLLEDCGNGDYIIYDYKTPKSVDVTRYKEQLILYAYSIAVAKGIISAGSKDFETVAKHFKLFVFFPLVDLKTETYEKCLKQLEFTTEDLENVMEDVKNTCSIIDGYDFTRPAEALQISNPNFQCKWCAYYGSLPQPSTLSANGRPFEGCPITAFLGAPAINSKFVPV